MVELRELMEIIPNFDFSDLNIIQEESSTVYQFYQDIENGLIQNDKEAIEHYFRGKPNSRIYYWRLKNKLYDKLANTYILTARKNSTPIQKAYFEIYRNYFIVNELYARNKNQAASILGEKTIDKAIKFELANIITSLCREVLKQYSTVAPNKIKVKKYISIFKKYSAIRNAEEEIELSLWNLLLVIAQSRNPQNSIGEFEEELNKTSTIFLKHPTLKIGFYYYMIQSYYYELKNDLWSTLYHCKKAIEFLETFENGVPAAYIFMFLHKKINIQIRLKQFKEAKINLEKAFCIIPKGTPNWYIINSYAVTLAFHEKDYHQAHGIINWLIRKR